MTQLNKNVRRVSNTFVRSQGRDRQLVIELSPGATDLIKIKEKGRRSWYAVPLKKIYELGARLEAEENRKIKAAKRKDKKCKTI
jgi:hypothetical protein